MLSFADRPTSVRVPGSITRRPDSRATLAVVSQRLPMNYVPDQGWQRSPGGLVSALTPALARREGAWFGNITAETEEPPPPLGDSVSLEPILVRPFLAAAGISGYANRTLWPALHGLVDVVEQEAQWRTGYSQIARMAASRIAGSLDEGASVWVQDYHYFSLARHLAAARPDLTLGLFCHTPVVAAGLHKLDDSRSLALDLAQFDFIGTQRTSDADEMAGFLHDSGSAARTRVSTVPVGFDVDRWRAFRTDKIVDLLARKAKRPSGVLLAGIDRADYTKGIDHKLAAFERLLASGAASPDDVRLVQIANPTRSDVPAYRALARELVRLSRQINASFPRTDGRPVVELVTEQVSPREVAGLMRGANALLVTAPRDGMNLVALEFAVLNEDRPASVVLGAQTGAADHIGTVSDIVSGTELDHTVETLRRIVADQSTLSDTSSRLHARSNARGRAAAELTSNRWASSFLEQLSATVSPTLLHR